MSNAETISYRILVCGNFSTHTMPQSRQCAEAFMQLGHQVTMVDTQDLRRKLPEALKRWSKSLAKLVGLRQRLSNFYQQREREVRWERIRRATREANPELVLVIRGNDIDRPLLDEMRAGGARIACWWIRDAERIHRMYEEACDYDIYYCIHQNLCRDGIRYLPAWSVDRERYYPATVRHHVRDIAFVGIWSQKRQAYLETLKGLDLAIVGPGWRSRQIMKNRSLLKHIFKKYIHGEDLTRFYQEARIVININQWSATEASGTTLRVADVPACGTFLLTEYSPGLEEVLTPDREVALFDSPENLRRQVDYWLAHDVEREALAAAGLARTLELPTPIDRARRIIVDLEGFHQ